jgi:hypothetical protein
MPSVLVFDANEALLDHCPCEDGRRALVGRVDRNGMSSALWTGNTACLERNGGSRRRCCGWPT